jgi:uncharacterized protein (TIGR03435 family)
VGAAMMLFGTALFGQTAHAPARFEVAAIKPSKPGAQNSSFQFGAGGVLTARNLPVNSLIAFAYDVRDFQLSGGPGWLSADRFDIIAKPERDARSTSDPKMTPTIRDQQYRERVLALLTDRFGLVAHKEMKEQQVYALTIAKGDSKLTVATTVGDRQGISDSGRGRLQGFAARTSGLAKILSDKMERTVLDRTGLTDKYDFVLEWTPDAMTDTTTAADAGPSIFTSLQEQLGLKLESSKAAVDTIVIDRVDRPSEN